MQSNKQIFIELRLKIKKKEAGCQPCLYWYHYPQGNRRQYPTNWTDNQQFRQSQIVCVLLVWLLHKSVHLDNRIQRENLYQSSGWTNKRIVNLFSNWFEIESRNENENIIYIQLQWFGQFDELWSFCFRIAAIFFTQWTLWDLCIATNAQYQTVEIQMNEIFGFFKKIVVWWNVKNGYLLGIWIVFLDFI